MMKRRSAIVMGVLMAVIAVTAGKAEMVRAESTKSGAVTIVTDEEPDEVGSTDQIRGGTNQDDAVLLPMNTKLYGQVRDGRGLWYAFTTDADESSTYQITTINKSTEENYIGMFLYDEYGKLLKKSAAGSCGGFTETCGGIATTVNIGQLSPSTTYYIRMTATDSSIYYIDRKDTIDYMMLIRCSSEQTGAYDTAGNLTEARGTSNALEGKIYPGNNQDDAAFIPTNIKFSGTVSDRQRLWFAFTTGSTEGKYTITTINKTVDSEYLGVFIYNEYGGRLARSIAGSNGAASSLTLDDLSPNTVYYMYISATDSSAYYVRKQTIDYTLSIKAPEEPVPPTASIEEEPLVFETPFELTETQVMFVANQAVFIDENAVKEALKPIADVILAHPDHAILLAGTTATDNTQEFCVDLSNRRAAAVKDVLVNTYGVPEEQLLTIGLGYEADPFVRGKDRDANGDFVETEGAKNRRVVVLDAEDPIAQELLGQ